ncbi:MAG: hypothetical protein ACOCQG_01685 [Candidatus Nanoarchaeia archaeon]
MIKIKRIESKNAQIPAQMFTYILTLLIIGLMLYFGVSWIGTLMGHSESISDTRLKTQLDDAFEEMKGNYGSMREYDFRVPQGLRTVCFLDKEEGEEAGSVEALNAGDFCDDYPLICEVWVDPSQNIAFEPSLDMPIEISDVEIADGDGVCENKCMCKNITDGMFSVRLVGKGDTVEVRD